MKTEAEINQEKANKPRIDLVPPRAIEAAGRAFGYGARKHGVPAPGGWGTWRIAGTEQAEPLTHYSCLVRHLLAWRRGETHDPESGLSHLDHAAAQLAILVDLVEDAPSPTMEDTARAALQGLPSAPVEIAVAAARVVFPTDPEDFGGSDFP